MCPSSVCPIRTAAVVRVLEALGAGTARRVPGPDEIVECLVEGRFACFGQRDGSVRSPVVGGRIRLAIGHRSAQCPHLPQAHTPRYRWIAAAHHPTDHRTDTGASRRVASGLPLLATGLPPERV